MLCLLNSYNEVEFFLEKDASIYVSSENYSRNSHSLHSFKTPPNFLNFINKFYE